MGRERATPPGPRGYLCDPPASQWARAVADNRARLAGMSFDVAGVPAPELRQRARQRVLALAGLGAEPGGGPADLDMERPLLVTGHQPQFYHPGIWVKAFAVAAEARRQGGWAVNVAVDHDAGELAAEIPWRDGSRPVGSGRDGGGRGRLAYAKEYLVPPVSGMPLETLPPPGPEQVEAFVRRVEERLATLGWPEGLERFGVFADGLREAARRAGSAAETGWRSRRLYERAFGQEPPPDVPVSAVSRTPEFLRFFVHWALHAADLRDLYNAALGDYRREHKVRSRANPFPDLLEYPGQGVELPFWGLTGRGVRRKLYALPTPDGVVLNHIEGEYARLPRDGDAAVEALLERGVQVRPRAVPLTVFHRLFVADLFVHGTGGGRYDAVTDRFIEAAFGVRPPLYAVVSATLHLPLGPGPVQPGAILEARRRLRDLRFNPQRYAWELDEVSEQLAALLRRKEELIDEIQQADAELKAARAAQAPRAGRGAPSRKRVLTREIEEVNAALYAALRPVEEAARRRLAELEARAEAGAAATRRTYPFFLFDPADVWDLLCVSCDGEDDGGQLTLAFPTGGR